MNISLSCGMTVCAVIMILLILLYEYIKEYRKYGRMKKAIHPGARIRYILHEIDTNVMHVSWLTAESCDNGVWHLVYDDGSSINMTVRSMMMHNMYIIQ